MPEGLQRLVGLAALVVMAPLLAALAAAVAVTMGRPVLYSSLRGGRRGEPFALLKFRSMRPPAYEGQPDAERLTRFGAWLRSTSLDELPGLVNIVRGDMVLVGPRPFFAHYSQHFDDEQRRRHEVKPGLTGWAQVNGRNALTWEERFALDVWYVDNRSWRLDLRIIAMTVRSVLRREGIGHQGEATMPVWKPDDADQAAP